MKLTSTAIPNKGHQVTMSLDIIKPCGGSIDLAHGMSIFGSLLSAKPQHILELGIGTGFITSLLLQGIEYNTVGDLTCVDNFHDLGGNLPEETLKRIAQSGVKVIAPKGEREFILETLDNSYDFLVSDADHNHSGEWAEETFRIIKPDSFMFFHDVNNEGYPNLRNYQTLAEKLGKPYFLFKDSSRSDEECGRGLLMVVNKK